MSEKMLNTYDEAKQLFASGTLTYNPMSDQNLFSNARFKIKVNGRLDHFTQSTLYENYNRIAENLKVYPTVSIYPRSYELPGGMGGFYHPDRNHIELLDHYYLISILSHEMRHAHQYIYYPDLYYATSYTSASEYIDCFVERDARAYSMDYCQTDKFWEEIDSLKEEEDKYERILTNTISASEAGMNEAYFKENPSVGMSVQEIITRWNTLREIM
ncbi:SprT family zinc-dependent metalloprotease [Alkalicoccobacillus gibsonii]|uniref:hypothetical protein n=1 Tax=Alkalicoccobacillus gibsonii TaxID=79881 RepID=UPI001932DBE1|nr:hypothetical protein [Alkalicoccobacillus gibsonii]MBM0065905.1 hypothetical protein [Alkalicoccobacillus gibsonii]